MTLDQFIATYNSKSIDYDKVFGPQCVDLAKLYLRDVFGMNPGAWGDARIYYEAPAAPIAQRFDRVANSKYALPKRGDIIVWRGDLPNSGGAGHIAICLDANMSRIISLDQNWGGKYIHQVTHNWTYVLGWLTPKAVSAAPTTTKQGGIEMIANEDQARKIYALLRPNGAASSSEISGTSGKRTFAQFLNDAQPEMSARDNNIKLQAEHLNNMRNVINKQNVTITELNNAVNSAEKSNAQKQKALDDAMDQMAKQNNELTTHRDQISDLQKAIETAQNTEKDHVEVATTTTPEQENSVTIITKLFAWFIKK